MINQLQDVSTRRSLSTAYRIRSEVRGGMFHLHGIGILFYLGRPLANMATLQGTQEITYIQTHDNK